MPPQKRELIEAAARERAFEEARRAADANYTHHLADRISRFTLSALTEMLDWECYGMRAQTDMVKKDDGEIDLTFWSPPRSRDRKKVLVRMTLKVVVE